MTYRVTWSRGGERQWTTTFKYSDKGRAHSASGHVRWTPYPREDADAYKADRIAMGGTAKLHYMDPETLTWMEV